MLRCNKVEKSVLNEWCGNADSIFIYHTTMLRGEILTLVESSSLSYMEVVDKRMMIRLMLAKEINVPVLLVVLTNIFKA